MQGRVLVLLLGVVSVAEAQIVRKFENVSAEFESGARFVDFRFSTVDSGRAKISRASRVSIQLVRLWSSPFLLPPVTVWVVRRRPVDEAACRNRTSCVYTEDTVEYLTATRDGSTDLPVLTVSDPAAGALVDWYLVVRLPSGERGYWISCKFLVSSTEPDPVALLATPLPDRAAGRWAVVPVDPASPWLAPPAARKLFTFTPGLYPESGFAFGRASSAVVPALIASADSGFDVTVALEVQRLDRGDSLGTVSVALGKRCRFASSGCYDEAIPLVTYQYFADGTYIVIRGSETCTVKMEHRAWYSWWLIIETEALFTPSLISGSVSLSETLVGPSFTPLPSLPTSSPRGGGDSDAQPDVSMTIRMFAAFLCVALLCCVGGMSYIFLRKLRAPADGGLATPPGESLAGGHSRAEARDAVAVAVVDSLLAHVSKAPPSSLSPGTVCCVCLDGPEPAKPATAPPYGTSPDDQSTDVEGQEWASLECNHQLHVECLRLWLRQRATKSLPMTCPVCRTPVCPNANPLKLEGAGEDVVVSVDDVETPPLGPATDVVTGG
ncbi:hypothetical protein DIPPA_35414 [Diplonema papillatum]|nr:hypothetical protein DIPPA_35414 [Diplonema papillatum]